MQFLKSIVAHIIAKPSLYLFVFLIIFSIDRSNRWFDHQKGNFPFVDDVDQFYSYLPAIFIHNDLTFSYENNYWTVKAPNGNNIARTTYGMALMYSPFFFIAHAVAIKKGNYMADGYSFPYKWWVHLGSLIYSLLGLWFCRKNLLRFFSEVVTMITLLGIYLGTNLFYYTYGWGEMSHSYLFFIISLFGYFTIRWLDTKSINYFLAFSFLAGFATLIRPTDFVVLLFPLMIGIKNLKDLTGRFKTFMNYKWKLIIVIVLFILPLFVQMIYWKVYGGSWLMFTYGEKERFFFSDPQIANFLFSFRKGWFIYTPVMFLAIAGIFFLWKTCKELFYFSIIYFLINIYLLSSWWDWSFGGSFGSRAIIQHYAFFAFGLASFISLAFNLFKEHKIINYSLKVALCLLVFLLIRLNHSQSWKYKYGLIHHNGMTKEAYFYVFNKDHLTPEEIEKFKTLIKPPDIERMLKGERDQ